MKRVLLWDLILCQLLCLSRLTGKIDEIRGQVQKEQKTKEINLNQEGIIIDDDTKALLNIGRSGFPPLKKVGREPHQNNEEGEIIFPIEDDMVLVEKFTNHGDRLIRKEHAIRIMNRPDSNDMRNDIYNHVAKIEGQRTAESAVK